MKIVHLSELPEEGVSHNLKIRKKVMLRAGDLPHLANFSQAYLLPGEKAGAHAHQDIYEVFYVESGTGVITVDQKQHRLDKGTSIVVEPDEVHEVTNTGTETLTLTYFAIRR